MESFEQLASQYEPMIHKIIRSLHIYKNKEDFLHVGFVSLWEATLSFDPAKGDFSNYAYSFIRGRILQEMERSNRHIERSVHPKEEFWETVVDQSPVAPLETEFLLSYCQGLTEKETKWVLYTCLEFLSVREIAQKENVSLSAVKQWRKGAKEKLQHDLLTIMD
ncbi:RNA polymerase subunit sigma-24 [Mesobacillus boroniphilus]|uniref:RNA polymerase subunit sigma-24 n=1 Tax=Mesobacillus boroniphilus TaxID=308892 RepID=A0A944CNM4_9BACI|nr:sigma-70 family RNA polymerase sigma factor [Mesobacillus boroniphilus]MBS8265726.1 RNA polymerase subunit sigma-24 [Mesobacillus boroniphilus]